LEKLQLYLIKESHSRPQRGRPSSGLLNEFQAKYTKLLDIISTVRIS